MCSTNGHFPANNSFQVSPLGYQKKSDSDKPVSNKAVISPTDASLGYLDGACYAGRREKFAFGK